MLRNIFLGTYFWITMAISLVIYPIFQISRVFSVRFSKRIIKHGARIWSKHLFFMGGIRLEIKGTNNIPTSNKVCFVSNHQSYLDIPSIVAAVPKQLGFVAKKELNNVPILNLWMPAMGCVLIDRKKPSTSLKKTRKRIEKIEEGRPLVIFPEGTRSKNGQMGKFKTGSIGYLLQNDIIIVPVSINGSYKLLEEKKSIKSGIINITFHQPFYTKDVEKDPKLIAKKLESIIGSTIS